MINALRDNQKLIRKMVVKVAGNQVCDDEIDDLVSAVNVELVTEKLARYDKAKGMSLSSYIGMIATRFTIDAMRKARDRVCTEDDLRDSSSEPVDWAGYEANVLERLVKMEQAARVRRAITKLPERMRDLLEAMLDDTFSSEAYAEAHGMTPNAVCILRCRSLKLLREMLTDDAE